MKKSGKQPASVRLLPAAMAAAAALLGVKAVVVAESVAQTTSTPAAPPQQSRPPQQPQQPAAQPANTAQCDGPSFGDITGLSSSEVQVLQALSARREALDRRSTAMETQDELMVAAEQRLNERLAELRRLEATVNDLLGNLDEAQEHRIAGLVDVYQRMRAKDAATVFDGLNDEVLIQVASRMRQSNLAEVMGRMNPQRARRLTEMLAERSRPPTSGEALVARATGQPPQPTQP